MVFFGDALQHITWKIKSKIVRVTARSIWAGIPDMHSDMYLHDQYFGNTKL